MRVLRQNKDSLMAVLEAFVYDPLLNWRLIDSEYIFTKQYMYVCTYYTVKPFVV